MIVLDTHVWIWWVQGDGRLCRTAVEALQQGESTGLGESAISCWEVAKLVEHGRLALPCAVEEWLAMALAYPGIELLPLSPRIAVESTQLLTRALREEPVYDGGRSRRRCLFPQAPSLTL